MKQSLTLKIGQQLTMTPQLQQAIRLLQLSAVELQQEIQETLESNPLLELDEEPQDGGAEGERGDAAEPGDDDSGASASAGDDAGDDAEAMASESDWDQGIPDDLPVDTSWDDIYQPGTPSGSGVAPAEDFDFDSRNSAAESLQDHLRWQLNLTPMSDVDRMIAMAIIDAINRDGLLTLPVEDIAASLGPFDDPEEAIGVDEVTAVLKRIQHFDPLGVAARDLRECLLLQLDAFDADTPWLEETRDVVAHHLELLAAKDFTTLKRRTKLDEAELAEIVRLIQSLNPRPGSSLSEDAAEYVVPDVTVSKKEGRWVVELNSETMPQLKVNGLYAGMIRRGDNSPDNRYLRDSLQEARWFLKSLQSRNETLLKVATKIVEHQRGFLEYGEEAMKPLVLHDIAEAVEMHESTISRVTSRKYMYTPRGIFELKYFFSSHVSTNTGGEVSSTAIRALIKKLTAEENPRKPLSDNKIAAILADQNIKVARRTVAKYRESMSIPPSNERKQLM